MDYQALAELLFPNVTETPDDVQARFPRRELPEGAVVTRMASDANDWESPCARLHMGTSLPGTPTHHWHGVWK